MSNSSRVSRLAPRESKNGPLWGHEPNVTKSRELWICVQYNCGVFCPLKAEDRGPVSPGEVASLSLEPCGCRYFPATYHDHVRRPGAGTRATIFLLRPTERPPGSLASRAASWFAPIYHVQVNMEPITAAGHRSHCVLRLIGQCTTRS